MKNLIAPPFAIAIASCSAIGLALLLFSRPTPDSIPVGVNEIGRPVPLRSAIPIAPTHGANPVATSALDGLPLETEFVAALIGNVRQTGSPEIRFGVPGGQIIRGTANPLLEGVDGLIEGRITHPKSGRFVFSEEDLPSVTGSLFGFVLFDDGSPGYQIRPHGSGGSPVLIRVPASDIVCTGTSGKTFGFEVDADAMRLPDDHPQNGAPSPPPEYQGGSALFSSRPGSQTVLYLDFDGEKGPFVGWGNFDAEPSGFTTSEIYATWLEVAEDFLPFNYNVTTDLAAYHAAPNNSRMRCIISPTRDAWDDRTGVVGVAYRNTFNSSADYVCWSLAIPGGQVGQIVSHELGHTLKLRHDGGALTGTYYSGHGAGPTSWGPIMGSAITVQMRQWSKGEYDGANEKQDDVAELGGGNNRSAYNPDGPGDNIANAKPLNIIPITGQVDDKEIIEKRNDKDVFWFRCNGGSVNLTIENANFYQNLDIEATLLDSTGAVVVTDNPANLTTASIAMALLPGDYYLQIDGVGYADPYATIGGFPYDGYTDYGSIGAYRITGTVSNADPPQRIEVAENTTTSTLVGTVLPKQSHSANPLTYAISGGNSLGLFAVATTTGAITVASSIDYEGIAGNWTTTPEVLLDIAITDTVDPGLNETVIVRLPITDLNEAPVFISLPNVTIYETTETSQPFASAIAKDEDFFQRVTYSITAGDPSGYFTIHADSGALSLVTAPPTPGVNYNLTISAQDSAIPPLATTGLANVTVGTVPPGFIPQVKPINPLSYIGDSIEEWDTAAPPDSLWSYGYDDGTEFELLDSVVTVNSVAIGGSDQARALGGALPNVGQYAAAPSATAAAVRRWTSHFNGQVKIAYDAMRLETGGDGSTFSIDHNGTSVFSQALDDTTPHRAGELIITVAAGDSLDFITGNGGAGDAANDWTHFHARVIDRYRTTEDADLLLHHAFDETYLLPPARAAVAVDTSGNNNHATVEAASPVAGWAFGEIDNGARIDGINDGIASDANDIGDTSTALTLSAWFKPDIKEPLDTIFGSSGATEFSIDFSDTGVGNPVRFNAGPVSVVGPDNSGEDGKYTHAVGVWSSGGVLKLYLDGVEVADSATSPTLLVDVDQWIIGRDTPALPTDPTNYFDGRIDDVALWSRALDAGEIRALYQNGNDVIEFDGTSDDYITLDHSPVRNGATELTLSTWYKPISKDNNDAVISSTGSSYFSLIFSGNGSGNPSEFRAQSNSLVAENSTGPTGEWTHAAGVWKSGEFQRLYLNGVEVGPSPSSAQPGGTFNIDDWIFGNDRNINNRYYHGSAGDLLIMERALDAQGVADLHAVGQYNTGATRAAFDRSDDIGAPAAAGRFEEISGRYLINASGAGFGSIADSGHFVSRPLNGDGAIIAEIDSVENTAPAASGGLMLRDSLDADAPFVQIYRTPDHKVGMRWRTATGVASQEIPAIATNGAPGWLQLGRRGSNFIGLHSDDGLTWSIFGCVDVTMAAATRIGMVGTSALDGTIGSSYFNNSCVSELGTISQENQWRLNHFTHSDFNDAAKAATIWGRDANPDGDEWTNFSEFAFGGDPNDDKSTLDKVLTWTYDSATDKFTASFPRLASGLLHYDLEFSNDLVTWEPTDADPTDTTAIDANYETASYIEVRDTATERRRFVTVSVSDPSTADPPIQLESATCGYYHFQPPAGSSAWTAGLVKPRTHAGVIDALAGDALTEAGATFIDDALVGSYVEILAPSPHAGAIFDITANSAETVTLNTDLESYGLAGDENFAIREHVTLGEMLPGGGGLQPPSDSLTLYYPDGSSNTFLLVDLGGGDLNWFLPPATLANDEVVYPGQGFVIQADAQRDLLIGQSDVSKVKFTPTIAPVFANATNLAGLINPLVSEDAGAPLTIPLADTGLLGTLDASTPSTFSNESVTLFSRGGGQLSSTGTFFTFDSGSGAFFYVPPATVADDEPVDIGSAFSLDVDTDKLYKQEFTLP